MATSYQQGLAAINKLGGIYVLKNTSSKCVAATTAQPLNKLIYSRILSSSDHPLVEHYRQPFKMPKTCIVIGGGISGPVAALVLSRIGVKCTIYELRETPATIGGAVNLTPNALRLLEYLDVKVSGCVVDAIELFSYHTGSKVGELSFRGPSGHSLRVARGELQKALLDAVEKARIQIVYGSKLVSIEDQSDAEEVVAVFENGSTATADLLLGCDGMYSAVRLKYVEPERIPIYTGVSTAYSTVEATGIKSAIHFSQTAVNVGRYGSLLASYTDPDHTQIYLAAVMETAEQGSREGWKVRGKDHEKTVHEVKRRYGRSAFPCLPELLEKVENWIFYPVCRLEPGGKWSRGRVVLLGDAAHGVCCSIA